MAAVPPLRPPLLFFFVFPLLLLAFPLLAYAAMPESDALLVLKKSLANSSGLSSWALGSPPCTELEKTTWAGVVCVKGVVTGLRLGHMGLSGKIDVDALLDVPGLRTISFVDNEFEGPIPSFNRLGALKAIYLTKNRFAGEIPGDFFSNMASLKKVWLSHNEFTGPIPPSLGKLTHLKELRLENNRFSGVIPPIDPPTLTSFNVSNNALEGSIPENFSEMDSSAFTGNAGLCGVKVGRACDALGQRSKLQEFLDASPRGFALVAIVVCLGVVLVSVAGRRRREMEFSRLGRDMGGDDAVVDVSVSSSSSRSRKDPSSSSSVRMRESVLSSRRGGLDLVMINDEKGVFGVQDLMKAAAEVLGTGGLGSSYKAILGNGLVVVVKRMREMNALGNDGFDAEMKKLGRLRHKNLLPPLAFQFRREEKLLVCEYVSKGSLLYLLHGDRGPSHAEMDWRVRLKIVRGIARGMAYLHRELRGSELPHGNLKSANVLIGSNFEPLLTDYGYLPLVGSAQAAQSMLAFKSPESSVRISPKSDVYCLGILILESLTGKYPCQYLNHGKGGTDIVQWAVSAVSKGKESEVFDPEISGSDGARAGMKRLLHLGVACIGSDPKQRPDIKEAAQCIEEIAFADEGGSTTTTL